MANMQYHLVQRTDMRKEATPGSKLFYGQVRSVRTLDFAELCKQVAEVSTASTGDVKVVIDGLTTVMLRQMGYGDVIRLGELGNFRMVAGSKGTELEEDFHTSLFKKGRIVYSPGPAFKKIAAEVKFEKAAFAPNSTSGTKPEKPGDGGGDGEDGGIIL